MKSEKKKSEDAKSEEAKREEVKSGKAKDSEKRKKPKAKMRKAKKRQAKSPESRAKEQEQHVGEEGRGESAQQPEHDAQMTQMSALFGRTLTLGSAPGCSTEQPLEHQDPAEDACNTINGAGAALLGRTYTIAPPPEDTVGTI